ncbi:MAG: N-6 DNA methylase [Lachnospiraceae bacterium]|nr:N-6 DNA methylase [Lachnospiraceae bacterium]
MKRINPNQLSLFDFVLEHPETPVTPQETVLEREPVQAREQARDNMTRCPYTVPTVEEIIKFIDRSAASLSKSKLISDVFACGAIAISNQVDFTQYDEREEQYKQIINGYKPQERELIAELFGKIFALLSSVVYDDGKFGDYLGELFMRCNQGNKNAGQFFTPFHISQCMAKMTITDADIKQNDIIAFNDPCNGGGGMLMAALDVLKNDFNVNYARDCFILAGDIDIRCVHMTYLQLALAGAPAIVCHQNTLTNELWSVWKTPAFIFQYPRFCKYDINTTKENIA